MKRILVLFLFVLTTLPAAAHDRDTSTLLVRAWPHAATASLKELGTGIGIVFTPDLSVPGNCRFYQALGFACFENADWAAVLDGVRDYNLSHYDEPIRTLILETHGTNGNGLKLQTGKSVDDPRSYISVGALQERLEADGVSTIVLSACNSGRLLRPAIYKKLDPNPGDKLFLPPTCGIYGATDAFEPEQSRITVVTSAESQIETTLVGSVRELAPLTRVTIKRAAEERGLELPKQFAVSELLIRMLVRDDTLRLRTGAHVEELSKNMSSATVSERLFERFVAHVNGMAEQGQQQQLTAR